MLEAMPRIDIAVTNPVFRFAVDFKLEGIFPTFFVSRLSAEAALNPPFGCVVYQPYDRIESLLRRGLQESHKGSFPIGSGIRHPPISEPETVERHPIAAIQVRGFRFVYTDGEQNLP